MASKTEELKKRITEVIRVARQEGYLTHSEDYHIPGDVDTILQVCREAGLAFVDRDSMFCIPAGGAANSDNYAAKGIGYSWERSAPIYESFYNAGYRQFEEIEIV